ncbi:MAG: hypothetical protein RR540_00585 [Oscillospiraceae bacterium]
MKIFKLILSVLLIIFTFTSCVLNPFAPENMPKPAETSAKKNNVIPPQNGDTEDFTDAEDAPTNPAFEQTATYLQDKDTVYKKGEEIISSEDNVSAIIVKNGGILDLNDVKIAKNGVSESQKDTNFFGLNFAVVSNSGSEISLNNSMINTDGTGAGGIFTTGIDSIVKIKNTPINTKSDMSAGLSTSFHGKINSQYVTIETEGANSAGLQTDSTDGFIDFLAGKISTSGANSPAILSLGRVAVTGSELVSQASSAIIMGEKSTVLLTGTTVSGSGDSCIEIGKKSHSNDYKTTAKFNAVGGKISPASNSLFSVKNVSAEISLQGVEIGTTAVLLDIKCDEEPLPEQPINVKFLANSQNIMGDIYCDENSTAEINLTTGTVFNGAINPRNSAKSANLTIDAISNWEVSADSYIDCFSDALGTFENIQDNGHTIYYNPEKSKELKGRTIDLQGGGKLVPNDAEEEIPALETQE